MRPILSMYIPFPERAIGPAIIQLFLLAALAAALYAYLHPRCGRKAILIALLVGECISFLPPALAAFVGLGTYGDVCRSFGANYSDWVLIFTQHFELYEFAIYSFICLLLSGMFLLAFKNLKVKPLKTIQKSDVE